MNLLSFSFFKILELKRRREEAGERRDGQACDALDAELFALTGDPKYAPMDEVEDDD